MARLFVSLALSGLLVAGCGSSTTLSTDDSGGGGADSGPRADGAAIDSGGGTAADTGSAGSDSGGASATDSGGAAAVDSGGLDSGATDAGGAMELDAGGTGVTCGSSTCGSGEICCVTRGSGGMMVSQTCTPPGDCSGASLACDGPEDCASGEACCGSFGGSGGAMCVMDSMCTFGRLCHADGECTGGDTCCAIMGAMVCSPFCRP